jgi:Ca2+-binding EF-hand superfamily protein
MNHSQQVTPDQSAMFQEQQRQIEELIKAFNIADPAHQGNVQT